MREQDKTAIVSRHGLGPRSMRSYAFGFISSVLLTLAAFGLVEAHNGHGIWSKNLIIITVVALAIIQFFVQMFYFLHLGRETRPRWKLVVFIFMVGTVLILVIGSLWIMSNLNYHMTQHQVQQYINSQDGL